MSAIVAIGEPALVQGYVLAGVRVIACANAREALSAWEALPADTGLLLLSAMAREALGAELARRSVPWAVLPG